MAERRRTRQRTAWYRAGEFIVAAQVPRDQPLEETRAQVLRMLQEQMPPDVLETDGQGQEPVVFSAPGRDQSLAFMFFTLADRRSPAGVRNAVETAQRGLVRGSRGDSIRSLSAGGIAAVGVMPHWNCAACYMGPSPGTFPRPIYAVDLPGDVAAHQYRTVESRLSRPRGGPPRHAVRVVVLDTAPNWARKTKPRTRRRQPRIMTLQDTSAAENSPPVLSCAPSLPFRQHARRLP